MHFQPLFQNFQLKSTSSQYMKKSRSSNPPACSKAARRISTAAPEHHVVSPVAGLKALGCSFGHCRASHIAMLASDRARLSNASKQPSCSSLSGFNRNKKSPRLWPASRFIPLAKPLFSRDLKKYAGNGNSESSEAIFRAVSSLHALSKQ